MLLNTMTRLLLILLATSSSTSSQLGSRGGGIMLGSFVEVGEEELVDKLVENYNAKRKELENTQEIWPENVNYLKETEGDKETERQ